MPPPPQAVSGVSSMKGTELGTWVLVSSHKICPPLDRVFFVWDLGLFICLIWLTLQGLVWIHPCPLQTVHGSVLHILGNQPIRYSTTLPYLYFSTSVVIDLCWVEFICTEITCFCSHFFFSCGWSVCLCTGSCSQVGPNCWIPLQNKVGWDWVSPSIWKRSFSWGRLYKTCPDTCHFLPPCAALQYTHFNWHTNFFETPIISKV